MRRRSSLALATLAGVAAFGLVFLQDAVFPDVLPPINPDVYLWAGGILAALVGALALAHLSSWRSWDLAFGAGAATVGYLIALSIPMLVLGLFGGFGCAYPQATWEQPGLYETAIATDTPEDWTIEHREPDGLAFANATLDEAWGSRYNLTGVSWEGPTVAQGRGNQLAVQLTPAKHVTTRVRGEADDATIAQAFRTVASNVTAASNETIDQWTQRFLDSRRAAGTSVRIDPDTGNRTELRFYRYSLDLPGPLAIGEHYAQLAPPAPRASLTDAYDEPTVDVVGQASTSTGNWTFDFEFAVVHAQNQDVDGEGITEIRVDALDRVGAEATLDDTTNHENRTIELVHSAFEELGWPDPPVMRDRVRLGMVC